MLSVCCLHVAWWWQQRGSANINQTYVLLCELLSEFKSDIHHENVKLKTSSLKLHSIQHHHVAAGLRRAFPNHREVAIANSRMKNPTALLFIQFSASFSFNAPRIVRYFVRQESIITDLSPSVMFAKNDKDEEDGPGMEDAFRQLDSLGSLDEGNLDLPPPKKKISKTIDTPASEPASLEQEAKLYTEMAKEVEAKQEDGLYDDILTDMGGTGVPKVAREGPDYGMENTEEFMKHAFEAALQEAKDSDPSVAESVLDNKDLMQEIEAIFEQGNEKLLESLEEVRREQVRSRLMCTSKSAP